MVHPINTLQTSMIGDKNYYTHPNRISLGPPALLSGIQGKAQAKQKSKAKRAKQTNPSSPVFHSTDSSTHEKI